MISGGGVDLAVGEHVQRVAELQRRVAEDEAQVDLLVDRHRRPELVGAHAHADDDDAREQRRAGDDAVDDAGHADALEDDGALRRRGADVLGRAPDVPPRQRQVRELLDGVDRELERRRARFRGGRGLRPRRTASPARGRRRRRRRTRRPARAGRARSRWR